MSVAPLSYRPENALITRGLAAHYDFKAGPLTSLVHDLTPARRDLTINSAVPGREGFNFTAASSQYLARTESPPSTGVMHVIGVARVDSVAATRTLASRWAQVGQQTWIMQTDTSGHLIFTIGGIGTNTSGQTLTTGSWFVFECYYDGTASGTRINATGAYTTLNGTHSGFVSANFAIGRNEDGDQQYLEGAMGYYLEYTRALAADEVQHTYVTLRNIMSRRGVALP